MTYTVSTDNVVNVVNILSGNWVSAHTANTTPTIKDVVDPSLSRVRDLQFGDMIYVYRVDEGLRPNDVGNNSYLSDTRVSIDINTMHARTRLELLITEVERIIQSQRHNAVDSSGNNMPFRIIQPVSKVDLSDKRIKTWRLVYDIKLIQPVKVLT